MARSAITVRELSSPRAGLYGSTATLADAADATNDHEFVHPGGVAMLHVYNGSGATMNVTIKAVAATSTKQNAEDYTVALADNSMYWLPIAYDDGYITDTGTVEIDIDQDTSSHLMVFKAN